MEFDLSKLTSANAAAGAGKNNVAKLVTTGKDSDKKPVAAKGRARTEKLVERPRRTGGNDSIVVFDSSCNPDGAVGMAKGLIKDLWQDAKAYAKEVGASELIFKPKIIIKTALNGELVESFNKAIDGLYSTHKEEIDALRKELKKCESKKDLSKDQKVNIEDAIKRALKGLSDKYPNKDGKTIESILSKVANSLKAANEKKSAADLAKESADKAAKERADRIVYNGEVPKKEVKYQDLWDEEAGKVLRGNNSKIAAKLDKEKELDAAKEKLDGLVKDGASVADLKAAQDEVKRLEAELKALENGTTTPETATPDMTAQTSPATNGAPAAKAVEPKADDAVIRGLESSTKKEPVDGWHIKLEAEKAAKKLEEAAEKATEAAKKLRGTDDTAATEARKKADAAKKELEDFKKLPVSMDTESWTKKLDEKIKTADKLEDEAKALEAKVTTEPKRAATAATATAAPTTPPSTTTAEPSKLASYVKKEGDKVLYKSDETIAELKKVLGDDFERGASFATAPMLVPFYETEEEKAWKQAAKDFPEIVKIGDVFMTVDSDALKALKASTLEVKIDTEATTKELEAARKELDTAKKELEVAKKELEDAIKNPDPSATYDVASMKLSEKEAKEVGVDQAQTKVARLEQKLKAEQARAQKLGIQPKEIIPVVPSTSTSMIDTKGGSAMAA